MTPSEFGHSTRFSWERHFHLTRNSLTLTVQAMGTELGMSMCYIETLITVFQMSYAVCKMIAGVLAEKFLSRKFMAFGLMVMSVINIAFGFCRAMPKFPALWIAEGLF